MVQTNDKCVALVLYRKADTNDKSEQEEDKVSDMPELSFLIHQLPSLYRAETRYALVVYDANFLKLDSSGMLEPRCAEVIATESGPSANNPSAACNDTVDKCIPLPKLRKVSAIKRFERSKASKRLIPNNEELQLIVITDTYAVSSRPVKNEGPQLDPDWQICSLAGLPAEVLAGTFAMLDAGALCRASITRRSFLEFGQDNCLWKHLCQSKWQVDFNELHMPQNFYNEPKEMYKFMSTIWKRVQKQCREQQRVAALATVLHLPHEAAQEVFLLCDA